MNPTAVSKRRAVLTSVGPTAVSSARGELQAVISPPQFLRRKRGVEVALRFGVWAAADTAVSSGTRCVLRVQVNFRF